MRAGVEGDALVTGHGGGFVFDAWYRGCHARVVRTVTVIVGDGELAADAASEAFARALAQQDKVSVMVNPDGWVFRTALNVARRSLRRRTMELRLLGRVETGVVPPPELEDEALWRAVRSLPVRQRTAVALRYVADLSESEVAVAMGVAEGTASATLANARRRLAELLEGEE